MNNRFLFLIFFIYCVDSLTIVKFPFTYIPLFGLADVDLKDFPKCDQRLRPMREKCENSYIKALNEIKLRHRMDINAEPFRRAVCCENWRMKACVRKAAEDIPECGREVAKKIMSNDKAVKEDVLHKCSEHEPNPPICNFAIKQATHSFFIFIISLNIIFLFF
jgi:hypothetical protein